MPPGAIYVGRPTQWANPYEISKRALFGGGYGDCAVVDVDGGLPPVAERHTHLSEAQAHEVAARAFRAWVDSLGPTYAGGLVLSLGGADLACWCRPDLACHADVLLELANPPEQGRP